MSTCGEPCDGCANRAEHHLCDACCHDEVDAIRREERELRAEIKELREVLTTAGNRLRACGEQLTEHAYQEMASVLFDLPLATEEES